ncbi:MAG: hypothetical protein AMK71_09365 [Nitrospira bacterium SG8_35_4]|nr:MAG: hypothetical protein AMK71_09365 [Nitrospira bacterium SG8_35_4]
MVKKYNCWEFMKCGREIGGTNASQSGVCPIAAELAANGLNGGVNAGRICWVVASNANNGKGKCSDLRREHRCFQCQFRYKVLMEEGLLNICKATGALLADLPEDQTR